MAEVLAIIPARGGSKGVPGKNIRMLDGIPLIGYAIETAKRSSLITDVLVNTDDEAIASVAKDYNVPVQMRDASLAQDNSPVFPTILESIAYAESQTGKQFDILILLQATSPLRTPAQTDEAIHLLMQHPETNGVISVAQVGDAHPSRMYTLDDAHGMHGIWDNGEKANRQQLQKVYIRNGCYYIARKEALLKEQTIIVQQKIAYIMDEQWQVNIDAEKDFLLAEILVKQWKKTFGLTY